MRTRSSAALGNCLNTRETESKCPKFGRAMDLGFIMVQNGRQASGAGLAYVKTMTDRSNEQVYFKERCAGSWGG